MAIEERRKHIRFPIMHNVGEPVELKVLLNHKQISLAGFIMDLSAGGMRMLMLGNRFQGIPVGTHFLLDLKLPNFISHHVEGKIVRIAKGKKRDSGKIPSLEEWFLGLMFTKIKSSDADKINRMAEDWHICETKILLKLPDICFRECSYWNLCAKPIKIKE